MNLLPPSTLPLDDATYAINLLSRTKLKDPTPRACVVPNTREKGAGGGVGGTRSQG